MPKKLWLLSVVFLLLGMMAIIQTNPAAADSNYQVVYQTPTARPDGRVIYIVQEGDSCLRIQLLTGITIDQLRTINRLDEACTLIPGKELLLAIITPQPSPTLNPKITPTPLLPTPTPFNGNGSVCVLLYNDINGDATREDSDLPLEGGAVSITDRLGNISKTAKTTSAADPICVEIPEGEYNISMAIPSGYNATTTMNLQAVKVQAGDQAILEFGAQVSSAPQVQPQANPITPTTGGTTSLLLAVLGGVLILFGLGLGIYVAFSRRG
jgi:hypothetical protein